MEQEDAPTSEDIAKFVSASGSASLSSLQPWTIRTFIALGGRFWDALELNEPEDRCPCHPLPDEFAARLSRLLVLPSSKVQEWWTVLSPLIAQSAAESEDTLSSDHFLRRHSIAISPVSYCIKDCQYHRIPLHSEIDNAMLYTLRHGVDTIATESLNCFNPGCYLKYHKDYFAWIVPSPDYPSIRTYYSSNMPEIIQVQDLVFIERDLCKWFTLTLSLKCPASMVAKIYNDIMAGQHRYPNPPSALTEENVLDAVFLYSRLQDSQRTGEIIKNLAHPTLNRSARPVNGGERNPSI